MFTTGDTKEDISRFRARIVNDAVSTFKDFAYFQGLVRPPEDMVFVVSEGLIDLLLEPESRDPEVVSRYMEWLYNLIRKDNKKIDSTIEFLDRFEDIVCRYIRNDEDKDIDVFFELCRDIVRKDHKKLLR